MNIIVNVEGIKDHLNPLEGDELFWSTCILHLGI